MIEREGVLAGIRVLDFGRYIAGPYCAALLADLGADVVRIERRGGGEDRWVAPVSEDGSGAMYLVMNRNKRAMTLDPACPEGREIVIHSENGTWFRPFTCHRHVSPGFIDSRRFCQRS